MDLPTRDQISGLLDPANRKHNVLLREREDRVSRNKDPPHKAVECRAGDRVAATTSAVGRGNATLGGLDPSKGGIVLRGRAFACLPKLLLVLTLIIMVISSQFIYLFTTLFTWKRGIVVERAPSVPIMEPSINETEVSESFAHFD